MVNGQNALLRRMGENCTFHEAFKVFDGMKIVGFDGTDRTSQYVGDLLVRQSFTSSQEDGFLLFLRV